MKANVYIYPSGTWSGSVALVNTSCIPPGQGAYNETLTIAVNAAGSGTVTAIDTPGFNRPYSVTFSDDVLKGSGAATSTATFSYLGLPVGGAAAVEVRGPTQVKYTETTTYNTRAATYTSRAAPKAEPAHRSSRSERRWEQALDVLRLRP